MRESLPREQINVLMRPAGFQLGCQLNLVAAGFAQCPVCHSGGAMAVHENGVRFACGCVRWLPPLHSSNGDQCKKCHPNVIPITRASKKSDTATLDAIQELAETYAGLG